jgi:hypothetical protein
LPAAALPEGRWLGLIPIPGHELQLVVDLAPDGAGSWKGSAIVTGLGIKGAPLSNLVVGETTVTFDLGGVFATTLNFSAARTSVDTMAGELRQGGNAARFAIRRTGPAQVELPQQSTAVARDIEAQWGGEFELNGYPRQVTITLENHAGAAATVRFVIAGKQTTDVPVDLVTQDGDFLRIESRAYGITYEGRFVRASGEIKGTIEVGSLEHPLVLHRTAARAS